MTKSCESYKCGHGTDGLLVLSVGICAGAGLLYLCAPRRGRVRRRWLVRQVEHLFRRDDKVCTEQSDSAVTAETLADTHLLRSTIEKIPVVKDVPVAPVRSKLAFASSLVFGLAAGVAAFGRNLHSPSHPGELKGAA